MITKAEEHNGSWNVVFGREIQRNNNYGSSIPFQPGVREEGFIKFVVDMFDVIIYIMMYTFLVFNYNCCSFVSMVRLKKLEIIIPHRWLSEIDDVLKDMQIGGMSATRIEGRGKVKPLPVAIQRGTSYATPEFIPRTKVEVIVRDDMVEVLAQKILERFGGDPNLGGKIFISDVVGAIDFVTMKKDEDAI